MRINLNLKSSYLIALLLLFLLSLTGAGQAQSPVAITATVTGVNLAPYSYGSYQVQLTDQSGNPLTNTVPSQNQFSGQLSSTGTLALSLYPNSSFLLPAGVTSTQWRFTICSAASYAGTSTTFPISFPWLDIYQQCYTSLITVTSAGSYSSQISTGAPALYYQNNLTGTVYSGTSVVNGAVGGGSVAFSAGAAAGSGPGTPTCVASHGCDTLSGVFAFQMGGSGTTTGVLATITVTPTTLRSNQANCDGTAYLQASPYTPLLVRFTETTAPTTYIINIGTAPTVGVIYEIVYQCGGN
jgi:hypothetical protein